MEGNFITNDQVMKLSSLPTREVLLSQLVGGLKSPIFGLHRALNWNLQKLVLTLNAVAKLKPAAASAPAPVSEPVKEETVVEAQVEATQVEQPEEIKTEEKPNEESKGGEN